MRFNGKQMRSKKTPVILLEQPGFKADSFTNYRKEDPPNKQLTPQRVEPQTTAGVTQDTGWGQGIPG